MNSKTEEALARLEELLKVAQTVNQSDTWEDQGYWSHADFDELSLLTEFLDGVLPDKFRSIIANGYDYRYDGQKTMAERLERILRVSKEFGSIDAATESDELLPTFELGELDKERALELSAKMRR